MPSPGTIAIYVSGSVIAGVVLDWAIFSRFKITVGAFGDSGEVRYRDLPVWRLAVVALASAIMGYSRAPAELLGYSFSIGALLFVASNLYGNALALRR